MKKIKPTRIFILALSLCLIGTIAIAQPPNDDCGGAITLTTNADLNCGSFASGTLFEAMPSSDPETCAGSFNNDIWFKFVATATTHSIQVSNFAGSTFDIVFQLSEGTCGSLTELFCHDTPNEGFEATGLTISNTYYVRIASFFNSAANTTFDICIGTPPPPPPNDDCGNAVTLTPSAGMNCSATVSGTLEGATASIEGESCSGVFDDDVWYNFIATSTVHSIEVSNLAGSTTDITYQLSNGLCGLLMEVDCHNTPDEEFIATGLSIGNTYYIRIASFLSNNETTTFDICVSTLPSAPSNDLCSAAVILNCGDTGVNGTTISSNADDVPNGCSSLSEGVWYTIEGTGDFITITVTPDSWDAELNLSSGTCNNLTSISCHETAGIGGAEIASFYSIIGTTYFLYVADESGTIGFGGNEGSFTIDVVCEIVMAPTNDLCAGAITLNCGDMGVSGTSVGSTAIDLPNGCSSQSEGVWYTIAGTGDIITITVTPNSWDAELNLSGGTCNNLFNISCHETGGIGAIESTSFISNLGTTYFLYIADESDMLGIGGNEGAFTIDVSCSPILPPPNDDCNNAISLTPNADLNCGSFESGTLFEATPSFNAEGCPGTFNNDIWFSFVATSSVHHIQVSNFAGSSFDIVFQLSEGTCGSLTELFCHDTPNEGFIATGLSTNTTYYVRIASFFNNSVNTSFDICIGTDNTCESEYTMANGNRLMGTETGTVDYETDGSLESEQTIDASAIVDYDSASDIILFPGFNTVPGALFRAFIDGCLGAMFDGEDSEKSKGKEEENFEK